jgi:hypothetical protein
MPPSLKPEPPWYLPAMRSVTSGLLAVVLSACGSGIAIGGNGGGGGGGGDQGGTGGGSGGGSGGGACMSLPADVDAMLNTNCRSCHGATLSGSAPIHLVTYDDLLAPSAIDPTKKVAERCLTRVQAATAPMPPGSPGMVPAVDVTTLQTWVSGGMQSVSTCNVDAGFDPFSVTQCTSGNYYSFGENTRMEPGNACISCHATTGGEAPTYFAAGTVYDTGHEPSRCDGVSVTGATVVFTDANNVQTSAPVNSVGNFYLYASLPGPFHVKVVYMGLERAMNMAPPSGDCNTCHTAGGTQSAPGRIVLPAP